MDKHSPSNIVLKLTKSFKWNRNRRNYARNRNPVIRGEGNSYFNNFKGVVIVALVTSISSAFTTYIVSKSLANDQENFALYLEKWKYYQEIANYADVLQKSVYEVGLTTVSIVTGVDENGNVVYSQFKSLEPSEILEVARLPLFITDSLSRIELLNFLDKLSVRTDVYDEEVYDKIKQFKEIFILNPLPKGYKEDDIIKSYWKDSLVINQYLSVLEDLKAKAKEHLEKLR